MEKLEIKTADDMHRLGKLLARCAKPGDLIMLNGPLGAGKTTIVQGVAKELGITARIQSPTFAIAVVHRVPQSAHSTISDLVHVDAYRLNSMEEIDALDLDASLDQSLTVVEWGSGKTEVLADERLEITIERPVGAGADAEVEDLYVAASRFVSFTAIGNRWQDVPAQLEAEWN